jgi:hypothetical protein
MDSWRGGDKSQNEINVAAIAQHFSVSYHADPKSSASPKSNEQKRHSFADPRPPPAPSNGLSHVPWRLDAGQGKKKSDQRYVLGTPLLSRVLRK